MTSQEIFDAVVVGLLQQGRKCVMADGTCVYLNEEGLRCAVGVLIPKAKYDPAIEGADVSKLGMPHDEVVEYYGGDPDDKCVRQVQALRRVLKRVLGGVDAVEDNIAMLTELQNMHDRAIDSYSWPDQMRNIALQFGLDDGIVDRTVETLREQGRWPQGQQY